MQKTIKIKGMSCSHCEERVKKALEGLAGVISVEVSARKGVAVIDLTEEVAITKFREAVEGAGYEFVGVE